MFRSRERRGLVVSTEDCHSKDGVSNLCSSKFFRDRKTINYEKTREKPECEATRRGVKTKKREGREKTEKPASESGIITRKEAIHGSLYVRKAIKWFHAIYQQKKASYSE